MAAVMTEAKLKERLEAKPDSLAFSRLADLYRKSGNITQAIDLCVRGVEQHPEYVTGRIILGRCYLEQENLDKAVEAFIGVCGIDRRNIVALKMLADIFMRQGFHEKAGDLFQVLAGIDPYNDILARSAAQTRGSGKHAIHEILDIPAVRQTAAGEGLAPEPRAAQPVSTPAGTLIEMPREPETARSAPPAAVAADSTVAAERALDIDIDEVISEATGITGADVTERMTDMFGVEEKGPAAPVFETPSVAEPAPGQEEEIGGEPPVGETIEVEPLSEATGISGTDVTERMTDLFGTKESAAAAPVSETLPAAEPTPGQEEEIGGKSPVDETIAVEPLSEATDIPDSDITERMTSMFEGEQPSPAAPVSETPPAPEPAPVPEVKTAGESPVDETIEVEPLTDVPESSAITERIDGLFGRDTAKMPSIKEVSREPKPEETGKVIFEELPPPSETEFEETMIMDADFIKRKEESGITLTPASDRKPDEPAPEPKEEPAIDELVAGEPTESIENAAGNLFVDEQDTVEDLFKDIEEPGGEALHAPRTEEEEPAVDDLIVSRQRDSGFDADDTISGDDVQRRIEQMLENKSADTAAADMAVSQETDTGFDADDTISGDDVRRRIEQMLEKKSVETAEKPQSAEADTSPLTDLFEASAEKTEVTAETSNNEAAVMELVTDDDGTPDSSAFSVAKSTATSDDKTEPIEELFERSSDKEESPDDARELAPMEDMDETSAASKTSAEDTITGDDVVERLEGIFEEKEEKEDKPAIPDVSLGRPGLAGTDTGSEATVVFDSDEKSTSPRTEPPSDKKAVDEAFFEIKEPQAVDDETAESSKPGAAEDTITGDDVAKRLEGMFEKKDGPEIFEQPPSASESTGTATEAIEDTALSSDSVIETVGILTGSDVEERLNDMFSEAEPAASKTEVPDVPPEKPPSDKKEEVFEPVSETIQEFEETIVSGDLESMLSRAGKTESANASPPEGKKAVDGESTVSEEVEEIFEAHPLEEKQPEPDVHIPLPKGSAESMEQTAVFEDFTPGSVPKAPPRAPDVPIFITSKETPVNSEAVLAEVEANESPYDIPDHVLTPTLADLYFQQGQPSLALSIYRRLLEKSGGENEKFKKRINEIEKAVADGTAMNGLPNEPAPLPADKKTMTPPAAARARPHLKKHAGATGEKVRPLSGVRLKKRPKIQWRKKAGEK
jgi:hypothetical protein